jgi:hypothetical protein
MNVKDCILVAWLLLGSSAIAQPDGTSVGDSVTRQTCASGQYRGFDSRLKVNFLGSVPVRSEIVGMEVMHGNVLVAARDALYSFDAGAQPVRIAVEDHIQRLMVSSDRRIWIETDKGFGYVDKSGIEMNNRLAALNQTGIVLSDSGEPSFLATSQNGETTTLALLDPKGLLPIANVPGPIRAASWSATGLAAVAGSALFTWSPNSTTLRIIARDKGLEVANDVLLLPENRVVVTLKNAVVLFSPKGHSIISGYGGRVRFDSGKLYVLDSNRALWEVDGIEALGDRQQDLQYAHTLEARQPTSKGSNSSKEAMRIVSCGAPVK